MTAPRTPWLLLLSFALAFPVVPQAQQPDILTNEAVVKMVKSGLAESR